MSTDKRTTVVIFSGSKCQDPHHRDLASTLGRLLAKEAIIVANGGGPGLMREVTLAAFEAGGTTIGVHFDHEGRTIEEIYNESFTYQDLSLRQKKLVSLGNHYIALPGGLGTLYETIELLAFKQVGSISPEKMLILIDKKHWDPLDQVLDKLIQSGYVTEAVKSHYKIVDTAEEAVAMISNNII